MGWEQRTLADACHADTIEPCVAVTPSLTAEQEIPAPSFGWANKPAPRSLGGAHLEIGEARFGAQEIQCPYANAGYPLRRIATGG
jgi:hypothetical protein